MVTATKKSVKRPDYLRLPAVIGFIACVVWIGYSLFGAITFRAELVTRINSAVDRSNTGQAAAGLRQLLRIQEEWIAQRATTAECWLQKFRPFSPDLGPRVGAACQSVAIDFGGMSEPDLATRFYSLAMAHDPKQTSCAKDLALECFTAKNYELGWVSTQIAMKNPALRRSVENQARFFKKHYKGPEYQIP